MANNDQLLTAAIKMIALADQLKLSADYLSTAITATEHGANDTTTWFTQGPADTLTSNLYQVQRTLREISDSIVPELETPLSEREDERKWVIPWGKDFSSNSSQTAWEKDDYGDFLTDPVCAEDWKDNLDYQFTDSEIKQLKSTQSPAIAQAIDIAKKLVSDEA